MADLLGRVRRCGLAGTRTTVCDRVAETQGDVAFVIFRRTDPLADELRRQLESERERTAELMATIVEMRREGFQMPPEPVQMDTDTPALPHEIMGAIDERGHSRQTREKLMQEGRRLLRAGAEPDEVAERIMQGERFNWGA